MASKSSLLESFSQRAISEATGKIKDLESAMKDRSVDKKIYFALGQAYFHRAAVLLENSGDPLSASLDLAHAMRHTEKSIALGYSAPEASIQVVAISAAQIRVYYSERGYMPEAGGLFEKLIRHFSYSANVALEKLKESSGKNHALVESIASAVEPLISNSLYQNLPQPYNESFATLCRGLGSGVGMMGVTGGTIDVLLSV